MNVKVDLEVESCAPEFAQDMYDELAEGFYKTAERIRDRAKDLVPVLTGRLRDSIRARRSRKKGGVEKLVQHIFSSSAYYPDNPAAFVFAGNRQERVYWQYFVEYGIYDKPAHPFMRPAVNFSFNAILAEAERAGKRAINKRRRMRKIAQASVA